MCIVPRSDIDQEDWLSIDSWFKKVTDALHSLDLSGGVDYLDLSLGSNEDDDDGMYSRQKPLMATMTVGGIAVDQPLLLFMEENGSALTKGLFVFVLS